MSTPTWLMLGFSALGFLVGNLLGLTSEPVVGSAITLFFAVVGGSVIVLLNKLTADDRRLAGQMIFCLALATLVGSTTGILATEYRVLSPAGAATAGENKYLRRKDTSEVDAIHLKYTQKVISSAEAYDQLRQLLKK